MVEEDLVEPAPAGGDVSSLAILRQASLGSCRYDKHSTLIGSGRRLLAHISSGWACRYGFDPFGKRQIRDFVLPGDLVGLHNLYDQDALHRTCALTDVNAEIFDLARVRNLVDTSPEVAQALLRASLAQARSLERSVLLNMHRPAAARVAGFIDDLARRMINLGMNDGDCFPMPLTQYDIADATSLTAIHLNRTLRSLREAEVMSVSRRQFDILSWNKLSALVPVSTDGASAD